MRKIYDIYFCDLNTKIKELDFVIDQEFFKMFDYEEEFTSPVLDLHVKIEKVRDFFLINFHLIGEVTLNCDVSLDAFCCPLESKWKMLLKFGPEFKDEDQEGVLILSFNTNKLNIAQYVYEEFLLALPKKRIHPDVKKGAMKSEVLKMLSKHAPKGEWEMENYIDNKEN